MKRSGKSIFEITMSDFEAHPVWCDFVDDDDIIYVPTDDEVDLDDGIYYCKSEFSLPLSVKMHGYIRVVDSEVMLIAVLSQESHFEVYNLNEEIRRLIGVDANSFAHKLGMKQAAVFPLKYIAQIGHRAIEGTVHS